jgi:hypothetical protein
VQNYNFLDIKRLKTSFQFALFKELTEELCHYEKERPGTDGR